MTARWTQLPSLAVLLLVLSPLAPAAPAGPVDTWLERVRAARGAEQQRLLLAYRQLDDFSADVPRLVAALSDHDPRVRSAAALALGDAGVESSDVVHALIRLLGDQDEHCRWAALSALSRFGDAVIPQLLVMLQAPERIHGSAKPQQTLTRGDREKTWRFPLLVGAYLLANNPAAAPRLLELASPMDARTADRRDYAALFLGIGDYGEGPRAYPRLALRRMGASAVPALVTGLRRADLDRAAVIDLLADVKPADAVTPHLPAIAVLLHDKDPVVAESAASLLELRYEETAERLLSEAAEAGSMAAKAVVARRAQEPPAPEKPRVKALEAMRGELDEQQLVTLTEALADPDRDIRRAAEYAFTSWQKPTLHGELSDATLARVIANLTRVFKTARMNASAALVAAALLGTRAVPLLPHTYRRLRSPATDEEADEALKAIEALGSNPSSSRVLEELAVRGRARIRVSCARVLVAWGQYSGSVVKAVAERARRDHSVDAIHLLQEMGAGGIDALRVLARATTPFARAWALEALGVSGAPQDLRVIVSALSDAEPSIRRSAIDGLRHRATHQSSLPLADQLRAAGISLDDVLRLLRGLASDEYRSMTSLELLAALGDEPESIAERAVSTMLAGRWYDAPDVLSKNAAVAAAFRTSLARALSSATTPTYSLFYVLGQFPDVLRSSLEQVIVAATRGDQRARRTAMDVLLAQERHHPSVLRYLDARIEQDPDVNIVLLAARARMADGSARAAARIRELAIDALGAGETRRGLEILNGFPVDVQNVDPLIELAVIEDYLNRLVDSLLTANEFRGETTQYVGHALLHFRLWMELGDRDLKSFTWPPPMYSERDQITDLLGSQSDLTLGMVDNRLVAALEATGYGAGSIYKIDGGFLRAAKMEQLTAARMQAAAGYRFVDERIPPQGFLDYLAQLFLARPGVYRLLLFAVTSASVAPDPTRSLTIAEAKDAYRMGEPSLRSEAMRSLPLGDRQCYVLIYEFEKQRGVSRVVPSTISAREHLTRAGLVDEFRNPQVSGSRPSININWTTIQEPRRGVR